MVLIKHLFVLCLQVFNKLIRRYKYLEKGFEEEIKRVRVLCKAFKKPKRQ